MSRRNLEYLFNPRSVALIGASDRPHSVGATVMRNLVRGGFAGPIWPVNQRRSVVAGMRAYHTVADLPTAPDLAIVCTPAPSIPGLIDQLGKRGTRAAVVISAGLDGTDGTDGSGQSFAAAMLQAAQPHTLRILGPNCIGVLVPGIGLNASFAHCGATAGQLAFVAQSGALTTAMLDWARSARIGFSHFISLGNAADVDFGDVLDHLGRDSQTRAILLYIESVTSARKFMSAARTAARNKPVIVIKSGRTGEAARAAHTHSGALAGSDAVYQAAFRRAGILRVDTTRQLFDAAEVLARLRHYRGPRLAILGNAGGPGVMATDALLAGGGQLAVLSSDAVRRLDEALPASWSRANPLDIGGDARPERYLAALDIVLAEPSVDAVLVIHAPTAVASVAEVAGGCVPRLAESSCPALVCWMGGEQSGSTQPATAADVPAYNTPEEAIDGFLHVVRHHQSQALLTQVPPAAPDSFAPDRTVARTLIEEALAAGRTSLTEPEAKNVLATYGIPVVETRIAREVAELPASAAAVGYPVALKVLSAQISHKSDVGGVALNIASDDELLQAAHSIMARAHALRPDALIDGFTVQKMIRRGGAHELLAGIAVDATFGPTIVFGCGGTAVEVIGDRAIALPPLNAVLARDLISQTRVQALLRGYRDRAAVDMAALEQVLIKLAQLAADMPEICELDINPLLADEHGVLALDARIRIQAAVQKDMRHLAIRPCPVDLDEEVVLRGHELLLRPIRPEDFLQHQRFLARVNAEDMRTRFFVALRELPPRDLAHLTQIDYEREMAFIAVEKTESGVQETLGVGRVCTDPENVEAEFAILVRSDMKGQGLGTLLLEKLIRYCRERRTQRIVGQALNDNVRMLQLAKDRGFRLEFGKAGIVEMSLTL